MDAYSFPMKLKYLINRLYALYCLLPQYRVYAKLLIYILVVISNICLPFYAIDYVDDTVKQRCTKI